MKPRNVVFILSLANILAYLDRYIMAAILPLVKDEFSLSNFEGGLLISAFLFGSLPLMPLFGQLGDRINRLQLMMIGLVAWTFATLTSALATGYTSLLLTRIAVGVGEASFLPNAPAVINAQSKSLKRTNLSLAIYNASIPLGGALGLGIGGYFAQKYGWRSPFYVGAALGLPVAFLLWKVKASVTDDGHKRLNGNVRGDLKAVLLFPRFVQLAFGFALMNFALAAYVAWLPTLGSMRGMPLKDVTMKFGLVTLIASFLGSGIGGLLGGRAKEVDTSVEKLMRFASFATLLATPLAIVTPQMDSMNQTMLVFLAAEILYFSTFAPTMTAVMGSLPKALGATGMAFTLLFTQVLSSLAAPPIVGALADVFPLANVLSGAALVSCVGGIVWLLPLASKQTSEPA